MSYSQILDNLFLGNQHSTKILDVDLIVSLGCNSKQKTGLINNVKYSIRDRLTFDITPFLDEVCDLIHIHISKGKRVLLHCKSGIHRSPAFTIAYLVKYHKMTLDEAKEYVADRRKIQFRENFMKQIDSKNESEWKKLIDVE